MPVGAYAGSREIMSRLAPEGDVYQAGTLLRQSGSHGRGLATLNVLEEEDGYQRLEALGAVWDRTLGAGLQTRGVHYARLDRSSGPRSRRRLRGGMEDVELSAGPRMPGYTGRYWSGPSTGRLPPSKWAFSPWRSLSVR